MPLWFSILTLIVIGIIFLLIEIFIIPGLSFAGVLSALCFFIAIYLSFAKLNFLFGIAITIGSVFIVMLLLKLFRRSAAWNQIMLKKTLKKDEGFQSVDALKILLGKQGRALTALHPSGIALIETKKYAVVTEGGFIEKDNNIEVIRVEGNRIVVRGK